MVSDIFKMSIWMKKTNDKAYVHFLINYYIFFFKYGFNSSYNLLIEELQVSEYFHEAIVYFFNVKTLVTPDLFEVFLKNANFQENLYFFILKLLDMKDQAQRRKIK